MKLPRHLSGVCPPYSLIKFAHNIGNGVYF